MKDIRAFLEISVEKELPKEQKMTYMLSRSNKNKDYQYILFTPQLAYRFKENFSHTLKEFSLPELMEEYRKEFEAHDWNFTGWTIEDFQNDFFTKKGIL